MTAHDRDPGRSSDECYHCGCCGCCDGDRFDGADRDGWVRSADVLVEYAADPSVGQARASFVHTVDDEIGEEAVSGTMFIAVEGRTSAVADFVRTGALRLDLARLLAEEQVTLDETRVAVILAESGDGTFVTVETLPDDAAPDPDAPPPERQLSVKLELAENLIGTWTVALAVIEGTDVEPFSAPDDAGIVGGSAVESVALAYTVGTAGGAGDVAGSEVDAWNASGGTLMIDVTSGGSSVGCTPGGVVSSGYYSGSTGSFKALGVARTVVKRNGGARRVRYLVKSTAR